MGFWELLLVLVVVLLFFGASRLPAIGAGLGKAVRAFRESSGSGTAHPPPGEKDRRNGGPFED